MGVGVGLGLAEFPFSSADAFWCWVDLCEESGIDSIWQTDRVISTEPFLECMSVMAALTGRTERIKFGMNVAAVAQRDPIVLAKACATIDVLSKGRLLPAFGVGSKIGPYWASTGRDFKEAAARTDEALEIISRLWSEEQVTFHGKHYRLTNAAIAPRPVQSPLPLWIGGSTRAAIRRTARYGTGWQAGRETPAEVGAVVAAIKQETAACGRRVDEDHFGASFHYRFGSWDEPISQRQAEAYRKRAPGRDPRDHLAIGDAHAIIARVEAYMAGGIAKFILRPIGVDDADVMEQTRRLAAEVIPAVQGRELPGSS